MRDEPQSSGASPLSPEGEAALPERGRTREPGTVALPLFRPDGVGPPSPAGGRRDARLSIGVGFRKAATAETLAALVREALSRLPPELAGWPTSLATIAEKDRPALRDAAVLLGLPVLILPKAALTGTEDRVTIISEAARACHGIPSVAEASALAAAGPGAQLVVTRIAVADATCAIAVGSDSRGVTWSGADPVRPIPSPGTRDP